MKLTALRAHFDGRRIRLDDTFEIQENAKLLVIVLPGDTEDEEREDWVSLSRDGLGKAYGENEPDYSTELVKEPNP